MRAQEASKKAQETPKTPPDGPWEAKNHGKTYGFRSIFTIRRHSAAEASRGLRIVPRWPQDGAKTAQDCPKTVPRGSQGRSRGPKRGPKYFQEGSKEGPRGRQERTPNKLGSNTRPGPLRDPSGTLPDPFGERFWEPFGPTRRAQGSRGREFKPFDPLGF